MPRRRNGTSGRSTRASTRSTRSRSSTPREHRRGQRAERVLPARSRVHLPTPTPGRHDVHDPDAVEIRGINSRTELAEVSAMVRQQKNEELMAAGVTLVDPATTYIDTGVEIGRDTVVHPCVFIEGGTTIGTACEIHAGSRIVNSNWRSRGHPQPFGDHRCASPPARGLARSRICVRRPGRRGRARRQLRRAEEDHARRRQQSQPSRLHRRRHDRRQGQHRRRHDHVQLRRRREAPTVIEDGSFIGSNTTLVAPVTVGRGAYIAAGSAITADVPAGALGIGARAPGEQGGVGGKAKGQFAVDS